MLVLGLIIIFQDLLRLTFELVPLRQRLLVELGSTFRRLDSLGLLTLIRLSERGTGSFRPLVLMHLRRRVRELVRIVLWRGDTELLRNLFRLSRLFILQARVLINLKVDVNAVSLLALEFAKLLN